MSESDSTRDSYDRIPYESTPFADTHPGHLACLARLYGVPAVDPGHCRVLELGCASGGNLIPMAARLPGSRFLGIELSGEQARAGAGRVAELGLGNCEIRQGDLMDLRDTGERFDYIIAHGVYSWAPPAVRERILGLAAELLSPHGIAYVSYNSLPGWRMRGMLRDMLLYRVRGIDAPAQRLAVARNYLDFLDSALGDINASNAQYLRYEIDRIRDAHPSYLFHEYLETYNEPVLFRDFVNAAAGKGLDYVCDIELRMQFPSFLGDHVDSLLDQIDDPIEQWQQIDFLVNRNFHQSLLCHADAHPARLPQLGQMREFSWFADLRPPRKIDFRRAKSQTFTEVGGEGHDVVHPLTKAALALMVESYSTPMPYPELFAAAANLLRAHGAIQFAQAEEDLLSELFSLYAIGVVHARPATMRDHMDIGALRVDPVATQCACLGDGHLPARHHGCVSLDPFSRRLTALLDGTRDRDAMIIALLDDIQKGGVLDGLLPPNTGADAARKQIERNMDRLLLLYRRQGILARL